MVYIEMGTDQQIDISRMQSKSGELLDHIFFVLGRRRPRW
jgi:hypothetical protein